MSSLAFVIHALPLLRRQPERNVCRRRIVCQVGPTPDDYRRAEMLDDDEASANMSVWNNVIHASLKRKLQGLVAESPVTNGVSALLNTAPGHMVSTKAFDSDDAPPGLTPAQVVNYLLSAFKKDALAGAAAFVSLASQSCHVRHTSPQTLLLFIGDNDNYRPLLRVTSFYCGPPRFEASGTKCVIDVEVHSPNVGENESAKFDFQLSCDAVGSWFIDEVFRL